MSDTGPEFSPEPAYVESGSHVLRDELPYIAMLLGAFVGVTIHDFVGSPAILYWQFLTPAFALICIVAGWEDGGLTGSRPRLIRTQAIHWIACFIAMRLLFLPEVRGVLNDNATGLSILTVLALSTFLAGLHSKIWRISVVGVLLALAVPGAAWLEQSALLVFVAALLALGAGAAFFWARAKLRD
jgi:hypothetical protein